MVPTALLALALALPQPAEPAQVPTDQPARPTEADSAPALPEAEVSPPPLHPLDRGWTFRAEPAFWYAAPRGDIVLSGQAAPVQVEGLTLSAGDELDLNSLDADNPTGAFLGRAHLASGRWRFTFAAAALSTDGESSPSSPGRLGDAFFTQGDTVDTAFDLGAYELSASYTLFHGPKPGEPGTDPRRFRYTFDLLAGARLETLDIDVDVTPGSGARPADLGLTAGLSDTFAQPIGGARLGMELFEDLGIEVGVTAGYWSMSGETTTTWDVLAAFSWRPITNVGVQFGYRHLGLSVEGDDDGSEFEYRGSAAGLFAGVIVQF